MVIWGKNAGQTAVGAAPGVLSQGPTRMNADPSANSFGSSRAGNDRGGAEVETEKPDKRLVITPASYGGTE